MGNSLCNTGPSVSQLSSQNWQFLYGEDPLYSQINHNDDPVNNKRRTQEIDDQLIECKKKLKQSKKLYKDPTLKTDPLILRSLTVLGGEIKCSFERPHIFLNKDPSTTNWVWKVNNMGDCKPSMISVHDEVLQYFGVFLCFIADHSQLIQQLIVTDENSYGLAVVKVCIGTKRQFIFIDDYVLCSQKVPLFSQPIKGQYIWPCLLEKAWLKIRGNILKKIQKNSPQQVFQAFLGYPLRSFVLTLDMQFNKKLLQQHLFSLKQPKGCIVTSRKQPPHKIGLSGRKHFYLLHILKYDEQRLFYMRNPCSNFDFRGAYRQINSQIQALIRKQCGDYKIAQGNFILTQQQFIQQIQYFSICYYKKQAHTITQQQISFNNRQQIYIKVDIKNDSFVSIGLVQHGGNTSQKQYYPLTYQFIRMNQNILVSDQIDNRACFGIKNSYFFNQIFKNLKAGQYLLRMNKKHPHIRSNKIVPQNQRDKIVVTASSHVKFDYKQQDLLKQKFIQFLKIQGQKQLQKRRKNQPKIRQDVEYIAFWLSDLAVVYIQKNNKNKTQVQVQCQFPKLKNLECLSTPKMGNKFVCLQPIKQNEVIFFQKIDLVEETQIGSFSIESF